MSSELSDLEDSLSSETIESLFEDDYAIVAQIVLSATHTINLNKQIPYLGRVPGAATLFRGSST